MQRTLRSALLSALVDVDTDASISTASVGVHLLEQRAAQCLESAGLAAWAPVAMFWCRRFVGMDRFEDLSTTFAARCVLRQAVRWRRAALKPDDQQVALTLAQLPFTRWQARWPGWIAASGRSERWAPEAEAFASFASRYPRADALAVWEYEPSRVRVEQWLRYLLLWRAAGLGNQPLR